MPFTNEQFFSVFAAYNAAIWPIQIAAYALGVAVVVSVWRQSAQAPRFVLSVLALMWLLNGVGYHLLFFRAINPVATLFGGAFVLEAFLLAGFAVSPRGLSFRVNDNFRSVAGIASAFYAMFIYPALGALVGHKFPASPVFGVAPCPTTIYTIGLLMRGRWVAALSIIPILWSLVGFAAAMQLGMIEDLALPVAGLVMCVILFTEIFRRRTARKGDDLLSRSPGK